MSLLRVSGQNISTWSIVSLASEPYAPIFCTGAAPTLPGMSERFSIPHNPFSTLQATASSDAGADTHLDRIVLRGDDLDAVDTRADQRTVVVAGKEYVVAAGEDIPFFFGAVVGENFIEVVGVVELDEACGVLPYMETVAIG